jgi:hypothetical protein
MKHSYPQVIHRLNHWKMGTWAIFALFLLTAGACCASAIALRRATTAFATAANALSKASEVEKSERLTPSKLAAFSEFSEALTRAEELLVKVNRREIARAKKDETTGKFVVRANGSGPMSVKDELRLRAGLRAGMPAPHS